MTRQRKKIHSAFTQFHTNVFNFFENLLHFVFSRKNKNSLGSAHRISFSGCVFKENIFLHFSLRNSEKVRKKIFTLIFFYSVPHIIFFCYWFSQRKYNVPLCDTHRTVLSGKKEFSEKNKKNKHIFLVRNNFFLSGPHTEQKK